MAAGGRSASAGGGRRAAGNVAFSLAAPPTGACAPPQQLRVGPTAGGVAVVAATVAEADELGRPCNFGLCRFSRRREWSPEGRGRAAGACGGSQGRAVLHAEYEVVDVAAVASEAVSVRRGKGLGYGRA